MLSRSGFILALDEATKKMIPFFVKVRSKDIIPTNPVEIEKVLQPTSHRWTLYHVSDRVDSTVYEFHADWRSTDDPEGESYNDLPTEFTGVIVYKLYKDGSVDVEGTLQILRDDRHPAPFPPPTKLDTNLAFNIPLPFELPKMSWNLKEPFARSDNISVSQPNGSIIPGTFLSVNVYREQIQNLAINPNLTNKTEYPYILCIRKLVETPDSMSQNNTFHKHCLWFDYVTGVPHNSTDELFRDILSAPVKFNFSGYWKLPK